MPGVPAGAVYKEIIGAAGPSMADVYTVPSGKKLHITDVLLIRSVLSDMTDATPTLVTIKRGSQFSGPLNLEALLRAFVPMNPNVFFGFGTPIEVAGPDKLCIGCGSTQAHNKWVFYRIFGYQ